MRDIVIVGKEKYERLKRSFYLYIGSFIEMLGVSHFISDGVIESIIFDKETKRLYMTVFNSEVLEKTTYIAEDPIFIIYDTAHILDILVNTLVENKIPTYIFRKE
jgi:hypothetical protein